MQPRRNESRLSYAKWNEASPDVGMAFILVIVLAVPDQIECVDSRTFTSSFIAEGIERDDKTQNHGKEKR